ncbi:hypothetical protein BCV72DRAFT_237264, partial [Rhizopus microsporus var. microsporus]
MADAPIDNIKLHSSWSLNNSIFAGYYYEPEKRYQGDSHIRGNGNCGMYGPQ